MIKHGVPNAIRHDALKVIDAIKSERKTISAKTVCLYITKSKNVWIDIEIYSIEVYCSHDSQSYLIGTQKH